MVTQRHTLLPIAYNTLYYNHNTLLYSGSIIITQQYTRYTTNICSYAMVQLSCIIITILVSLSESPACHRARGRPTGVPRGDEHRVPAAALCSITSTNR